MKGPLVLGSLAGLVGLTMLFGKAKAAPGPSSGTPASGSRPTLRSGSSGSSVRELQERLNAGGETLTVDGRFGALTEAAVRRFQNRTADPATGKPLVVDGIVGPRTWAALVAVGGAK